MLEMFTKDLISPHGAASIVAMLLALPAMGDYLVVIIREALTMMPQLVLG